MHPPATYPPLLFAPLQGYTDDAYRRLHHQLVGGAAYYYTPFVRIEGGGVRSKDLRDLRPDFNVGVPLVPQLIASSAEELRALLAVVRPLGYRRLDVNMGCPFPLQARHGRGSGLLPHPDRVAALLEEMGCADDIEWSVKLRLGWDSTDEAEQLLPLLNAARLHSITLHPRLGTQGYKGEVDIKAFEQFAAGCTHALIYNGDLRTPDDIARIARRYPRLDGIMIGRGWLARPSLGREVAEGREWPRQERIALVHRLHERLHAHYASVIPGEAQLHAKLRSFWDYMESEVGRKALKRIQKAGNLRNYLRAVQEIA